jgi:diaminohydroxyphosphoribosylaminopyrimidine deaminase/5-amino-6-(5-phosphoribosylamino)uracil reductase
MKTSEFMKRALELSLRGTPSPNPYVGCVIVKNSKIIGEGYHKKCGEDHAEIVAIKDALQKGNDLENSILYVTLEPCCHYGKTPPCTSKIIECGISQIYVALQDPNIKVNGKGISKLRAAGIKIHIGLLEKEAMEVNEIYLKYITTKRPFVLLKSAISLDGKIATKTYESKWISNDKSRQYSRKLRSKYDAILVGINTVLKDNPKLSGINRNPLRIILDSKLKIPLDAKVLSDNHVLIVTTEAHGKEKRKKIEEKNINYLMCGKEQVNLNDLMKELGRRQITSVLVEGGGKIITSFLKDRLADKVNLYISPKIIGADAIPFVDIIGCIHIEKALKLNNVSFDILGDNVLVEGYLK